MVTLTCAIVGEKGSAFPVKIDAGETVGDLKDAIKSQSDGKISAPWPDLQLFLAKTADGAWLKSKDLIRMWKGEITNVESEYKRKELDDATEKISERFSGSIPDGSIHVLVVVPVGGKRHPSSGWFAESFHTLKKRRVGEDVDKEKRFFDMRYRYFPPLLEHPQVEFKTIVEREAYVVIFAQLMQHTKACLEFDPTTGSEPDVKCEPGRDSNVVVTGNPGIGKSRFFLYCIFQLILQEQEDVKRLPPYELVVNHKGNFVKYDTASNKFIDLNRTDVRALMGKRHVIRLVEATSSELMGWRGVSVLFAYPGANGINNFSKVGGLTFIMPTWTLEELKDYNSLLPVKLKLTEDELLSRYDAVGGIPRFVFSDEMKQTEAKIKMAIASFSALDVISYCKKNAAVREKDYSHCVLKMVPTEADFRTNYYLDFVSIDIAEAVIDKVHGDSLARVSEFAVGHDVDDSESTAAIRGKMYKLLCHMWFSVHMQRTLHFRSLCSTTPVDVTIPKEMETVRFASLDELKLAESWTYYRPKSKTFGALDAFIWDGHSKCYGLQLTLNADHGIKAAPLNEFLKWLTDVGVDTDQFYIAFLVPSKIAPSYLKQSMRTATGEVSKNPGASAKVGQFVAALDVDGGGK